MKQSNKRLSIFVIISLLLLVTGLVLAVRLGSVHIAFTDIYDSIFNYSESLELMLVRDVRIPRALSVLMTGEILGVTGAMIQGVTKKSYSGTINIRCQPGSNACNSSILCSRNWTIN